LYHVINNPGDLKLRDGIIGNISSINSNYLDIYTGLLTLEQLMMCMSEELKELGIKDRDDFFSWIGEWEFKLITLSDRSGWVLRKGVDDELYIHVHPARYAPNIVRIHGNSWKSAVVTKIFYPQLVGIDILAINEIRVKYLNLSPIKSILESQRLLKAMKLLENS